MQKIEGNFKDDMRVEETGCELHYRNVCLDTCKSRSPSHCDSEVVGNSSKWEKSKKEAKNIGLKKLWI